jgi:hypothetical protein
MGLVVYGTMLCGKTDVVPGVGYVATEFSHLDWFPTVPQQSWFIKEGSEGKDEQGKYGWIGVKLPSSRRSVVLGYGRAVGVCGILYGGACAMVGLTGLGLTPLKGWLGTGGASLCLIAIWMSYMINRASPSRAIELSARLDLLQRVNTQRSQSASR